MVQALIWIDDEGGIVWLRHRRRWLMTEQFAWQDFAEKLLLPAKTEVTIISALSGEQLIFDVLPKGRFWEKYKIMQQKMITHYADMPYRATWLSGQRNALQCQLAGVALPREALDCLLTHFQIMHVYCKRIIPVAGITLLMTQKKYHQSQLWIVIYRKMHLYFIDEAEIKFCRTIAIPADITALEEELKKIHRYIAGQKWLKSKEKLKVHGIFLTSNWLEKSWPVVNDLQWHEESLAVTDLWQHCSKAINCLTRQLKNAYFLYFYNRLAWFLVISFIGFIAIISGFVLYQEMMLQKQIQQQRNVIVNLENKQSNLGSTAQTLLAIAAYQKQYQDVDYEKILRNLSHVLVDFPTWSLESIEWQNQDSHKLRLIGHFSEIDHEQIMARFERALTRQLQARQIHTTVLNTETKKTEMTIYFSDEDR